ncbi:MAG: hypothetical protein R3B51_09280 [Thermodesulfobacteriota bacterium]
MPGDSFGADSNVRISFATSMENIVKGMDRIEEAVASWPDGSPHNIIRIQTAP